MKMARFAARFALMGSLCLALAAPAEARFWQCVPYARELSGIQIHGNAWTWWGQAKGEYERGSRPRVGAVMSFKSHGKMKLGHVAYVSEIVSSREVLLTHANWSKPGGIEKNVRAVDVSPDNDWSEVRVWYGPIAALGGTTYPLNGFIYNDAPGDDGYDGGDSDDFQSGGALPGQILTIVNN